MLDKSLVIRKQAEINASIHRVWFVLTDSPTMSRYLYGAHVITDWTIGSGIIFEGEFEGNKWRDKGVVREFSENSVLAYDYWSGFCGLPDLQENYARVTLSITPNQNGTRLTIEQIGYASQESFESSAKGWEQMLATITTIAEELEN
jgi:uncharacterized protein YndB with AHSA1/START domain